MFLSSLDLFRIAKKKYFQTENWFSLSGKSEGKLKKSGVKPLSTETLLFSPLFFVRQETSPFANKLVWLQNARKETKFNIHLLLISLGGMFVGLPWNFMVAFTSTCVA